MGNAVLGSWIRTAAVAGALIAVFAVLVTLIATGRLGDLRYSNIPLVHPYPPAGFYQNPFNPGDRSDLIKSADASNVRADLLRDGQLEVAAFASGDASGLTESDTGNALKAAQQLMAFNNAKGVTEKAENHLDSLVVGRLSDPNDPSVTWCVQEKGSSTITYADKSTGRTVQTVNLRFVGKYWLVRSGSRYLITDVEISTLPGSSG